MSVEPNLHQNPTMMTDGPSGAYMPPPPDRRPPPPSLGAFDPRSKSAVVASFLSVLPGLGHVYIGHYRVAFLNLLIFAGTITVLASDPQVPIVPLAPIFLFFFWLYNIIDAGRRAALYNLAVQGGAPLDLPMGPVALPGPGSSLAAGIILVVGGAIVLSNTVLGYSLRWIEDWWPVAPIAFGLWLILHSARERAAAAPPPSKRASHDS